MHDSSLEQRRKTKKEQGELEAAPFSHTSTGSQSESRLGSLFSVMEMAGSVLVALTAKVWAFHGGAEGGRTDSWGGGLEAGMKAATVVAAKNSLSSSLLVTQEQRNQANNAPARTERGLASVQKHQRQNGATPPTPPFLESCGYTTRSLQVSPPFICSHLCCSSQTQMEKRVTH